MIDTKRLATDAAYWRECDPSGGEATHFDEVAVRFIKRNGHGWLHYMAGQWISFAPVKRVIPRPQAPEAEWVDGLPRMGARVECTFAVEHHDTWHKGKVTFHGIDPEGREFFIVDTGIYQACYRSTDHVRPLRTKEQRQKDELEAIIHDCTYDPKDIADAILSRYNLEQKS